MKFAEWVELVLVTAENLGPPNRHSRKAIATHAKRNPEMAALARLLSQTVPFENAYRAIVMHRNHGVFDDDAQMRSASIATRTEQTTTTDVGCNGCMVKR